jgi:gamma-glutamylcyclotransferase (GGCT)/AIG2-like uncharacterized protein YtfP
MYQARMFSYGTLQRAGALYDLIQPAVKDVEPAILEGYGIYKSRYGLYPEAFPLKGHSIKGELFTVDANHPRFIETMMMELKAGYNLELNEVVTPNGFLIRAMTFIYREQPTGYLIEDGNWLKHAKSFQNSKI